MQGLPKRLYPGIGARITFPFLLATVVVAGIGVFIVTRLVAGSIQERINNQLGESATAATNTVEEIERQHLSILRSIAFTEGMDEAITSKNSAEIDQLLRPIAFNTGVEEIIVFDAQGNGLVYLSRANSFMVEYQLLESPILTTRAGIQRVIRGEVDALGDKHIDIIAQDEETIFYFNAPIMNSERQLVGGVSVGVTSNQLILRIREQALSSINLYLSDGQVIDTTFRNLPETELLLTAEQTTQISSRFDSDKEKYPTEEIVLNQETFQAMYVPFEIRDSQIGLLSVVLPKSFIADKISTSRDYLALLFSGLFMGIALLGIVVSRTISHPVKRLVNTTRAIREGDLSRRVGLRLPDELGELSVSFDHMTDQLVQRNQEISHLYHQQIQETARREAVLTSISDALIVLNSAKNFTLLNQAAEMLIKNCERDNDAYFRFTQLCHHPEDLLQPQTIHFGSQVYSVLATPVTMPSEELLGHVIVFRDITALIEAEHLKDEIILQLSHELRTPLASAKGYIDLVYMLKKGQLDAQGYEFVGNTRDHLGILERMINQVIDVSTMIAGDFRVEIESFELSEVIRKAIDENMRDIEKRGHQIMTFLPGNKLWMKGDKTRLFQVMDHLLRNAHSYTPKGGLIEVNVKLRDEHVYVSVHDNGVGIDTDELEKVFECMYRGRSADAGPTDSRGLGLGLYITQQVIEAHGGCVSLRSKPNYGTTVTLELPMRIT